MTNCSVCKGNFYSTNNIASITKMCYFCRRGAGWKHCNACNNITVRPNLQSNVCEFCVTVDGKNKTTIESSKSVVVNDYTCTTCKNNKCSKSEGKCWWCGTPFTT